MVVLQAHDPIEAIRLRARRLFVIRRGKVISEAAPEIASLSLPSRPPTLDPASFFPKA
jgi:cytosine deaminase